ncbi:MAG: LamG-like jellyroll fold domain-containing protein, partial [Cyclobacteriaceae bacterium]|nr:LamG-like jellyroll fold domain-containing protein [Cyclobacteriaceae bacterium]
DIILSGSSNTIINTTSTTTDDFVIDHRDATLCGTGTTTLLNGAGSSLTFTNGATINQVCTSFTIACSGMGCSGFPVSGTGTSFGNRGPGGVFGTTGSTNLTLWLNASTINQSDNTNVTSWTDRSGYSNNANAVSGNEPVFRTNIINGNPTVRFVAANTDYLRVSDAASLRPNSLSIFIAGSYSSAASQWAPFIIKATNYTWTDGYAIARDNLNNSLRAYVTQWNENFVNAALAPGTFTLINMVYDRVNVQSFYNGTLQGSDPFTSNITNSNNFLYIGISPNDAGTGVRQPFDGDISEIVLINRNVTLIERILIQNYLAAKYGLTLGSDDVYTMDNAANGNFDFDVAGIGQASDGTRNIDARGTGIVRMAVSASSLSNNTFLLWGHNNLSLTSNFTDIDHVIIKERLNRVWRVSEVGDVSNVTVSFDISGLSGSPVGSALRLLIDRDGDGFADNDVTPIGGGTLQGGVITFTGINFQDGDRFTLGNTNLASPLPVELAYFRAKEAEGKVELSWRTESEINNDYFTIERSADATNWMVLMTLPGRGTTTIPTDYIAYDDGPLNGLNYYRLKQTDYDGSCTYSRIVSVFMGESEQLDVYPNPFEDSFTVKATFDLTSAKPILFDLNGRVFQPPFRSDTLKNQL